MISSVRLEYEEYLRISKNILDCLRWSGEMASKCYETYVEKRMLFWYKGCQNLIVWENDVENPSGAKEVADFKYWTHWWNMSKRNDLRQKNWRKENVFKPLVSSKVEDLD